MNILLECKPKNKSWVIWPSLIFFQKNALSVGDFNSLTLAWICFGISIQWGK